MFAKEFSVLSEIKSKAQAIEAQVETLSNQHCDALSLKLVANKWMARTLNKTLTNLGPLDASELKTRVGSMVIQLQSLVLDLDAVESHGNKTLREARKQVVMYINSLVLPRADTLLRRTQSLVWLQDKLKVVLVEEEQQQQHDEEEQEEEAGMEVDESEHNEDTEEEVDEEEDETDSGSDSESESASGPESNTSKSQEEAEPTSTHAPRSSTSHARVPIPRIPRARVPSPSLAAAARVPGPSANDVTAADVYQKSRLEQLSKQLRETSKPQQRPHTTHEVDIRANAAVITISLPSHVDTEDTVLELEKRQDTNVLNVRDRYNRYEPLALALNRNDLVAERARVVPDDVSASRMHIVVPRRQVVQRPTRMAYAPQQQRRPVWGW